MKHVLVIQQRHETQASENCARLIVQYKRSRWCPYYCSYELGGAKSRLPATSSCAQRWIESLEVQWVVLRRSLLGTASEPLLWSRAWHGILGMASYCGTIGMAWHHIAASLACMAWHHTVSKHSPGNQQRGHRMEESLLRNVAASRAHNVVSAVHGQRDHVQAGGNRKSDQCKGGPATMHELSSLADSMRP
eukprot:1154132-Pelagomonas_calceolata.AAC.2